MKSLTKPGLYTDNPELLIYLDGKLHVAVLGGIRLTGLDRLKVTLKITRMGGGANNAIGHRHNDSFDVAFRHNLDLYNSIQVEQLIEKSSETLETTATELQQMVAGLTSALEGYRSQRLEQMKPKTIEKRELSETERKAATTFLKSPDLLKRTAEAMAQSGIVGEETNSLVAYLVYTSRKRTTPLHLMYLGASGTGKTWLQEKVSAFIPEEDKLEITTLSSNAFYYFGKEELKHKLLLIEDLDGAESVLYPLRELQSKKRISKTVTLKDSKGNLKTVTLNVEGPVCVSGCTTREELYEDNANRCLLLYMDNSPEQDRKIMDYQRKISAGQIDGSEERKIQGQLKNVQRVLQPITIRNPFAEYLDLPESVLRPRRTMLLLILFTETITYYHQLQRELKTDEATGEQYIESTVEDIESAFGLLEATLLKKSDELNDATRSFFERLKGYLRQNKQSSFYAKDIRSAFRLTPSSLKRYLWDLERMGYIKIVRGTRYKGFEYVVDQWDDMDTLRGNSAALTQGIINKIREAMGTATPVSDSKTVARSPRVAQGPSGPHKKLKMSENGRVAHEN